jgi:hypothetical protein
MNELRAAAAPPRLRDNARMKWLYWLRTGEIKAFARDLANFIASELAGQMTARDAKFKAKAEKTMVKAARRLQDFKASHRLNFYTRSILANNFLWALKDAGCPPAYADELTEWLTLRL